jgi:hypothetical protein
MDDICGNNHGGNEASELAWERASHFKERKWEIIIDLLRAHDQLTSKEIGQLLGLANPNHYAPRISELKCMGMIRETGERRGGANVLRLDYGYEEKF